METTKLPGGWYVTTRPSHNDVLVSPFDPRKGWPKHFVTGIFVSCTPRGRFSIQCVDHSGGDKDHMEWVIGGTGKSFGFRFVGMNVRMCEMVGALLDGRSTAFATIDRFYNKKYAEFCKNARAQLPKKLAYYKWPEDLQRAFTKTWGK